MADAGAIARVVVCVDAAGVDTPALQVAGGLALGLGATLAGLYVEDERLMRVAALPFAQEFSLASATARSVSLADVERGLRLQAEQFRRLLAAMADSLVLMWTLDVVRGDLQASPLASLSATDMLVLGRRQYVPTEPDPRAGAGKRWHPGALGRHPMAVVYDGTEAAQRALAAARALVGVTGSDLIVLVVASDLSEFQRRQGEAARHLQQVRARYQPVPAGNWQAVMNAAAALQATAILRSRSDGFEFGMPAGEPAHRQACSLVLIP